MFSKQEPAETVEVFLKNKNRTLQTAALEQCISSINTLNKMPHQQEPLD